MSKFKGIGTFTETIITIVRIFPLDLFFYGHIYCARIPYILLPGASAIIRRNTVHINLFRIQRINPVPIGSLAIIHYIDQN